LVSENIQTSLSTRLHSLELNLFQPFETHPNLEFLLGLRYFRLNEQFHFQTNSVVNQTDFQSQYNLQTTNNLYGAQIGWRWLLQRNRWFLAANGKIGAYYNDASQQQFFGYSSNITNSLPRDMAATRASFSVIQEVGINGIYQWTDWCSFRVGYNLFAIQGLARAGDQVNFSSNRNPAFYTHGSAVLHGPSAGIEFRF
jgi:hypothetical protein